MGGLQLTRAAQLAATGAYAKEVHVSALSGNDTSGNGNFASPYATINAALASIDNSGCLLRIHAGTYYEGVTFNKLNVTIIGATIGGNVNLAGNWEFSGATSSVRVSGVSFSAGLYHTGSGNLYLNECGIVGTFSKSGQGYFEATDTDAQGTGITINGSGYATFIGGKQANIAVNHASAVVTVKGSTNCSLASVSTGVLMGEDTLFFATSITGNCISSTGTVFLNNCSLFNSTGAAGRVSLGGTYSINNTRFDEANSTITGSNIGTVSNFDAIKVGSVAETGSLKMPWIVSKAYPAGAIVEKDGALFKSNAAIPVNTTFSTGSTGATWTPIASPAVYGEVVAPGAVVISSGSSADILTVTLPPGTWEIQYIVRTKITSYYNYGLISIVDSANNVVPNSQILSNYFNGTGITELQSTVTGVTRVTTTAASSVYKLRVAATGAISVASDASGGLTKMLWKKL